MCLLMSLNPPISSVRVWMVWIFWGHSNHLAVNIAVNPCILRDGIKDEARWEAASVGERPSDGYRTPGSSMVAHMEQLLMQLHVAQTPPNRTALVLPAWFRNARRDSALPSGDAEDAQTF